jgi:ketosteroid isomerase-like protein
MKSLVLIALCGCATAHSFTPADRAAVTATLEAQVAAWNREDIAGFMDKYARSDQLVFTSGGKIRRGWQATYDAFRTKYATAPGTMGQLQFEVLQIDPAGADGCVVLGRWTLVSGAHPATGIFSVVLERQSQGWRVIHDHTSADP